MKSKQPNPSGRPLPSRYARTFYQSKRRRWGWIERSFKTDSVIIDFYETEYRVMASGSIERV